MQARHAFATGRHCEFTAELPSFVDFDGDWNARNNWENAGAFALRGHGYYSLVETATHWFIVYMFFHPRDWTDFFFDTEHENDSEGVLLAVAHDGSTYGSLKAAVTVAHTATDPAKLVAQYFTIPETLNPSYTWNAYR